MASYKIKAEDASSQAMEVDNHQVGDVESDSNSATAASSAAVAINTTGNKDGAEGSEREHEKRAPNPAFSKFMKGFWDLASVDVPVRVGAAAMIVRHVSTAEGDAAYAVKRLVRGVCSSRDSARQGFASCLAQVLTELPESASTTPSVLEKILQTTQTTSAVKGADERDLVLGRLLGISAIALSGRLKSEPKSAEMALKVIAELYVLRKWLAQAAGEAALLVISKAFEGQGDFTRVVLPVVRPLLNGKDGSDLQVSDLSSDQLLLSLGLQSIIRERGLDVKKDSALKGALPHFMRQTSIVRLGKIQELVAPLKQSASAFPKKHSVWGWLWDDVGLSPAGKPRAHLSDKRLKRLGEIWSMAVDEALTSTSINTKGTALLVLQQVLQRVPAAGVCHVLSPGIVRLMLNHTKGERNYLYSMVKMTLTQLPKLIEDDQEVQAQVVACLMQRGSVRFDILVGMKVVTKIVNAMGQEAMNSHMEFLKEVARGIKPGLGEPQANGESSMSIDQEIPAAEEDGESFVRFTAERLQAVETLWFLARRADDNPGVGANVQAERLSKTAEFFLEMGFFAPDDSAAPLTPKMLDLCQSKFFSLVAAIASKPLFWRVKDKSPLRKINDDEKPSLAGQLKPSDRAKPRAEALESLWGLHEAWRGLEGRGRKLVDGVEVGADEREACSVALVVVRRIKDLGEARGDVDNKLGAAFAGILLVVSLHLLEGSNGDGRGQERCQHILDLVETYGRMSQSGDKEDRDVEKEEDDDEEPDPLAMLVDVLVAIVAEPSTHSVKGLREIAKKMLGMVCSARPLTKSAVETLVAAVCGDDESDAPADGGEASSSEDDDEDEDDGEEDGNGNGNGKGGDERSNDGEEDGEKNDDVMVGPSDLEELLRGDDGADDEGLQHHSGADAALSALLELKKSGRKRGTVEAQRQVYQIRLRALDLLEIMCLRHSNSRHFLSALLPVLKATKELEKIAPRGNSAIGEASALATRLRTLYSVRLCKCKPWISGEPSATPSLDGEENPQEGFVAETAQSFSELVGLCRAWRKDASMVSLALEGALCCIRALKSHPFKTDGGMDKRGGKVDGDFKALTAVVRDFFVMKRGAALNIKQVVEVVRQAPEFLVPVLISAAEGEAASSFLKTTAFGLLTDVLQRRSQMDAESRKALLAQCPKIVKVVGDVLRTAAAEAEKAVADDEQHEEAPKHDNLAASKTKAKPKMTTNTGSSANVKKKTLKPLLGCLSVTITAVSDGERGDLEGVIHEVQDIRRGLGAIGEASASLAVQALCNRVAQQIDDIYEDIATVTSEAEGSNSKGGKFKKAKLRDNANLSPGAKRKAVGAGRSPVAVATVAAASVSEEEKDRKTNGSSGKKKRQKRKNSS